MKKQEIQIGACSTRGCMHDDVNLSKIRSDATNVRVISFEIVFASNMTARYTVLRIRVLFQALALDQRLAKIPFHAARRRTQSFCSTAPLIGATSCPENICSSSVPSVPVLSRAPRARARDRRRGRARGRPAPERATKRIRIPHRAASPSPVGGAHAAMPTTRAAGHAPRSEREPAKSARRDQIPRPRAFTRSRPRPPAARYIPLAHASVFVYILSDRAAAFFRCPDDAKEKRACGGRTRTRSSMTSIGLEGTRRRRPPPYLITAGDDSYQGAQEKGTVRMRARPHGIGFRLSGGPTSIDRASSTSCARGRGAWPWRGLAVPMRSARPGRGARGGGIGVVARRVIPCPERDRVCVWGGVRDVTSGGGCCCCCFP